MNSSLNEVIDGKAYFVFPRGKDSLAAELFISFSINAAIDTVDSPRSEQFRQRWIKDDAGNIVGIDSRGWEPVHGAWRSVSFRSESVAYSFAKPKPHKILDQIIDSACIAAR